MYFICEATTVDGVTAKAMYEEGNAESAKSRYHGFLASCYANQNLTYFMGMYCDESGNVIEKDHMYRAAV